MVATTGIPNLWSLAVERVWGNGEAEAPYPEYKDNPKGFILDVLGDPLDEWQEEVCDALVADDRIAVRSANGVGKTYLAARLLLWWIMTRALSRVVSTAPSNHQVEDLLWQEVNLAFASSRRPLAGRCMTTRLVVGHNHFATGFATDRPTRFQGAHAPGGVLFLGDEASGIHDSIFHTARTFRSGGARDNKALLIGNPNHRKGYFFECFEPESTWRQFKITAADSPRVAKEYIEEVRHECRPDPDTHPVYQVTIMAEFPTDEDSALFPMRLLNGSENVTPEASGRHLGVDIARFGSDSSVATLLVNGVVSGVHRWRKKDTMATAGIVEALIKKWKVPARNVHLDVIGVGGGVVDRLHQLGHNVEGVDFGGGVRGEWTRVTGTNLKFPNRRVELYYAGRMLMADGQLCIPRKYGALRAQLAGTPYDHAPNGDLRMPPKDKIKSDLGHSPDDADSFILALSRPVLGKYSAGKRRKKRRHGRRAA